MESVVHLIAGILLVLFFAGIGPFGRIQDESVVALRDRFELAAKIIGGLVIAFSLAELIGLDPTAR